RSTLAGRAPTAWPLWPGRPTTKPNNAALLQDVDQSVHLRRPESRGQIVFGAGRETRTEERVVADRHVVECLRIFCGVASNCVERWIQVPLLLSSRLVDDGGDGRPLRSARARPSDEVQAVRVRIAEAADVDEAAR